MVVTSSSDMGMLIVMSMVIVLSVIAIVISNLHNYMSMGANSGTRVAKSRLGMPSSKATAPARMFLGLLIKHLID